MIRNVIWRLCAFCSFICAITGLMSCQNQSKSSMKQDKVTAADILGNPEYQAISYGGYRRNTRDIQPSVAEIKEDLRLLSAMGIKILRTYNVHLPHASNILKAIFELREENPDFEMYVMLGAWIDCQYAWSERPPNHEAESPRNQKEIDKAIELAQKYPEIVKVIAVGNEAMVKWAASYFVEPWVILKYVKQLQKLKKKGILPKSLWITSSDNFASWGGGGREYHNEDLNELIRSVDYLSIHTYPMHDTHYHPVFWGLTEEERQLKPRRQVDLVMGRALRYAISQYDSVKNYMLSIGVEKPIHIGETGWASVSQGFYGINGSAACDEYKQAAYYNLMREWCDEQGISCFFFEAFDEPWKDAYHPGGSENHFGLFTVDGKAKYALWDLVDQGLFNGLGRSGRAVEKTFEGNEEALFKSVELPSIPLTLDEQNQFYEFN